MSLTSLRDSPRSRTGCFRVMLPLADRVIVSLSMDIREDFTTAEGVHDFSMSKETVRVLLKIAADAGCEVLSGDHGAGRHRR